MKKTKNKICITKRKFGDLKIFVSDKNPNKKINKHKVNKYEFSFDKKINRVSKIINPPENGGEIL